jgi:hypothetical protein
VFGVRFSFRVDATLFAAIAETRSRFFARARAFVRALDRARRGGLGVGARLPVTLSARSRVRARGE